MQTPEWLTKRDGSLKLGSDRKTWYVMLGNDAEYALEPVPAENKFACAVRQTVNGQRLSGAAVYPTLDDALKGGLEELRKYLGWA
jgi:hypothetical protein